MTSGGSIPMGQYSKRLKNKLNNLISEMAENPSLWARNPSVDFIRNRKISFTDLIRILLSSGGNSLNKELYDYFKPTNKTVTASAFVQQRNKLLPDALAYLLCEFNWVCSDTKLYNGYRLFAVDGSTMTFDPLDPYNEDEDQVKAVKLLKNWIYFLSELIMTKRQRSMTGIIEKL